MAVYACSSASLIAFQIHGGGAITVVTIAPIEVVQLFVSHAKHVSTAAASSATRVHILNASSPAAYTTSSTILVAQILDVRDVLESDGFLLALAVDLTKHLLVKIVLIVTVLATSSGPRVQVGPILPAAPWSVFVLKVFIRQLVLVVGPDV